MRQRQRKKPVKIIGDADALFLGTGVRAIARKSMLPGYTVADLQQFLNLLYGMFGEKEAKEVTVFDPFSSLKDRRITVARLADALEHLVEIHDKKAPESKFLVIRLSDDHNRCPVAWRWRAVPPFFRARSGFHDKYSTNTPERSGHIVIPIIA